MCEHAVCDISLYHIQAQRSITEHYNLDISVGKGRILVKGSAPAPSAGNRWNWELRLGLVGMLINPVVLHLCFVLSILVLLLGVSRHTHK